MIKERPILFNGDMVRAILIGQKTQTRRPIKNLPECTLLDMKRDPKAQDPYMAEWLLKNIKCPFGQVGDRLYVRETWRHWVDYDQEGKIEDWARQVYVAYRATPRVGFRPEPDKKRIVFLDESTPLEYNKNLLGPWKPSLHMPRWASRILLEIDEIKVERIQEISGSDAYAEGFQAVEEFNGCFRSVWDSIYEGQGLGWEVNPYVWVVKFHQVEVQS
jgi:hypothetical protein